MSADVLRLEACVVDLGRHLFLRGGWTRRLTGSEVRVLRYLSRREGVSVDRRQLLAAGLDDRTLDATIARLRQKIELDHTRPVHLRSADDGWLWRRGNVPAAPPPEVPTWTHRFVGRAGDVAAVGASLEATGLVVITGPPGIGKSRLARQIALGFPQSWTARLTWTEQLADVFFLVAAALDVPIAAPELGQVVTQLARVLSRRGPGLLVLDDAGAVLSELEPAISAWRTAAPQLRVIATTTDGAGYRLTPLDEDDAIALLRDRDRLARTTGEASDLDRARAARDARAVGNNPLAIELAAVWPEPPDTSAGDPVTSVLSWLWDRLPEEERDALSQVSVFHGGFDTLAALEVAGVGVDVLDRLVDRSLLVEEVGDAVRFEVPEPVRRFALERAADVDGLFAAHRTWFVSRAERAVDGAVLAGDVAPLLIERENVLAAMRSARTTSPSTAVRLALALDAMLAHLGPPRARLALLEGAVADAERAHRSFRADLLWRLGDTWRSMGDLDRAETELTAALQEARSGGDLHNEGIALGVLGAVAIARYDHEESLALLKHALDLHRRVGNTRHEGIALLNLAGVYEEFGRTEQAEALYRGAVRVLGSAGDRNVMAVALAALGVLARKNGNPAEALAAYRKAMTANTNRQYRAYFLAYTGNAEQSLGRFTDAERSLRAAIHTAEDVGDDNALAGAMASLALLLTGDEQFDEAAHLYARTEELLHVLHRPFQHARLLVNSGILLHLRGRVHEAVVRLQAGVDQMAELGDVAAEAWAHLGAAQADADRVWDAMASFEAAEGAIADADAVARRVLDLCLALLDLARSRADADAAAIHVDRARERLDADGRRGRVGSDVRIAGRLVERRLAALTSGG